MGFAFVLSLMGFGSEILKGDRPAPETGTGTAFAHMTPTLRSPANRSEFDDYPRQLELVWEPVLNAVSYRVETQIQVEVESEHRVEWTSGPSQQVTTNHCQIKFGSATWGQWRVIATNREGTESQSSDWWMFHFTR
jgi:hypothetical protein